MESNQKPSLIKDLWDRRVFHFFATYLGASWALIQFAEWLVKRYSFEDSIVDKIALFLLICLPAFLIFVYNHGRSGPDDWKPFEKVFIPINLVTAAALSFFIISPKTATKTLDKVFTYWKDADENFKYLLKAQELKRSLEKQ